jgi:hypothetical protein
MNIPTTDYPALIEIINQTYTSGLDAILAAKMVGKNKMLVLGQDGPKQLAIELSPENIAIKWINSGQKPPKKGAESFGESSLDDALLNAAVVSMAALAGIDLPISFSEAPVLDLDEEFKEGGKAFKCKPENISCKGRCISGWKVCREGMNAGQIKMLDGLMKKYKQTGDEAVGQQLDIIKQVTDKVQILKSEGKDFSFDKALDAVVGQQEVPKPIIEEPEPASVEEKIAPKQVKVPKKAGKKKAGDNPLSALSEEELVAQAGPALNKWGVTIKKDDGTFSEIDKRALESWAGSGKYYSEGVGWHTIHETMNRAYYAPESLHPATLKEIQAVNELTIRAYAKIPSITPEAFRDSLPKYQQGDFDTKNPPALFRNINLSSAQAQEMVDAHKKLIGKEITKPEHFATSARDGGIFGGEVSFRVKAKWDGTGQGKGLENFKGGGEAEVMFPPGSRFRVIAVTDPNDIPPPEKPQLWENKDETAAKDIAYMMDAGGDWKAKVKKKYAGGAFEALPEALQKAETIDEIFAAAKVAGEAADDYKKAINAYKTAINRNIRIIDMEEI